MNRTIFTHVNNHLQGYPQRMRLQRCTLHIADYRVFVKHCNSAQTVFTAYVSNIIPANCGILEVFGRHCG